MHDYLTDLSIIIVDDQEFDAKLTGQMLTAQGARGVRAYLSAEHAWRAISEDPPDLIILDWAMQPIDGISFTKRIRDVEISPNPYLPIILLTAHRERRHVYEARDAGVNEYVIKPVSAQILLSRIQAVVENPRDFVRVGDFFGPDRRRTSMDTSTDRRSGEANFGAGGHVTELSADDRLSQNEINRALHRAKS